MPAAFGGARLVEHCDGWLGRTHCHRGALRAAGFAASTRKVRHGQAGTPTARPDGGSRCFDDQVSSCQTGTADQMRPPWWGLPGSKDADPAIGGPERRATTCGKQRHDSALTLQLLDG